MSGRQRQYDDPVGVVGLPDILEGVTVPPLRAVDRFYNAGSAGDERPPDVPICAKPLLLGEQPFELRPVIGGDLEGPVNMAGQQRTLDDAQRRCLARAVLRKVEPSSDKAALDQHVRLDEEAMKCGDRLREVGVVGLEGDSVGEVLVGDEVEPVRP